MIQVLIVDDQEVVRKGLEIILSHSEGIEVVGIAVDGEDGIEQARRLQPDVILMDLKMPNLNGIHATRHIMQQNSAGKSDIKVVVLTTFDGDDWIFDAIHAGATGYLLKDAEGEEIAQAVRDAADGKARLDPTVASKILATFNRQPQNLPPTKFESQTGDTRFERLTERELSILQRMAQGMTNQEISETLFLAPGTIKNNVSNILSKLHSNDRTQAVLAALRSGIVTLDS